MNQSIIGKCDECYQFFCTDQESYYICEYCKKNLCYKCFQPISHKTADETGGKEIIIFKIYYCMDCIWKSVYTNFKHKKDIY